MMTQQQLSHPIGENNMWRWSIFSEEKQLYFNGYGVLTKEGVVIIDPPTADEDIFMAIESLGDPVMVLLTNREHERESDAFRKKFSVPVAAHELDAPLLQIQPEMTFKDGEMFHDYIQVIHIPDQKSPGESAFYINNHGGMMILGDALISKQSGVLTMLPDEKYADKQKARVSLERLLQFPYPIDMLLLGDGDPIMSGGISALEGFFGELV